MAQRAGTKAQKVAAREPAKEHSQQQTTDESIRKRAYEIYLERGAAPGQEVEDWLQAERELRAQKSAGA